jgi:hypothetical protein
MKKIFFLLLTALFAAISNAQLTGTKNIPGDYTSLETAITDLNTQGVGAGGVVLNLLAGNPQIAPAGGYVIGGTGSAVLTTASATNSIIIQGNGNTITASSSLTSGALTDAIFKLIGADWVTLTGFIMEENPANTTTGATTNNMTEWGVALLYVSTTDGCQNITIHNNTIDLNRTYQNTFGIYSNSTHSATSISTSATATGPTGGNHNLTITANTITDVNMGIVVVGPTAAADMNNNCMIGGSPANANIISNFGTTGTFSGYANVSGTVNGILVRNTNNFTISHNSITSSAGGTNAGTLNGIQIPAFSNAPTGITFTNIISNNNISLQSAVAAGAINGINYPSGSASTTSTININNNNFHTFGHTVAASGTITFILNASTHLNQSISNNTFTNLNVNTTGGVTFISNTNTLPAGGVKNVNNNAIVGSFTKTGSGASVTFFTDNGSDPIGAINNSNNNIFANVTVSGTTSVTGISNTNGGSPTKTVNGNQVYNIGNASGAFLGINVNFDGGTTTVNNNAVYNISMAGTVTGINLGATAGGTTNTFQNTVHTLTGSGTNAVTGIAMGGSTGTRNLYNNKIYNLENSNAGGAVYGITLSSGATLNVYNNLIGDLRAPIATTATNVDAIRGINITSATTSSNINISFNTVYLNASSSGANFYTAGIFHTTSTTATTAALNMRNNIIVNLSTPAGTGITSAYRRSSTTLTNYGSVSNNNLLYAGSPSANRVIFYDGTNTDQTLAAYKSRVAPRDGSSVTENPPFLSTTGSSTSFLHIDPAIPTQVESSAIPISGISTDYDGDTRHASMPDIGADEGNFILLDLTGPSIQYTLLSNTLCINNIILNATITDVSGVNTTAGTRPRIYYKKSTNANSLPATNDNTTDGWKYTETSNTSNPFSLLIDYSRIFGGVAGGDVIQYFVVAQDLASTPNVNINSGTFAAQPASVALTSAAFPIGGTINSYNIISGGLSGTVTIGAAGTYPSLTGAGGLFQAINSSGLTGNVTAAILDASISESGTHALNQMIYGCGGPFTLTIKPASGVTTTLTGSFASGALFRILSNNVTIDGSNSGGTSRDMTLTNTSTTSPTVLLFGSTGTQPIQNSGVKNSIIINGASTATAVVVSDGASLGAAGYFNNITIQNNSIQRAFIGNYNIAVPAPGNGSGLLVTGNDLNTAGANAIRFVGIYVQGVDGAMVSNNQIGNFETLTAENDVGIWFASGTVNSTASGNQISNLAYTGTAANAPIGINLTPNLTTPANLQIVNNTISGLTTAGSGTTTGINLGAFPHIGTTIRNNRITNIKNTNTGGWGSNAITLGSTSVNNNISVYNNFISDVASNGFSGSGIGDNGYGMVITGGAGYTIAYNSIYLNTEQTAATGQPAVINITSGVTMANAITLVNNILVTTQTVGTNRYAIYSGAPASVYALIDHNDYYSTGPNLGFIGSNRATLSDIQAGFGGNLNSISYLPSFVSSTDLHLTTAPGDNWCLNGAGVVVPGITTDIDGQTRSTGVKPYGPDLGADEFTPTGFVVNNPSAVCAPNSVDLTAASITSGSMPGLTFTYWQDANATIALANPNAVAASGTYYIRASNGTCFLILPVVVTINPQPNISSSITEPTTCVSTDGAITLTISGAPGPYTFSWTGSGVNPTSQNQTGLAVGGYSVLVTASNGCSNTANFTLSGPGNCNVCPTIPTLTTTPSGATCTGQNTTLTASGLTDMGNTYGIRFLYSSTALPNPYTGGTTIAIVPNAGLGSGGTTASTSTTFSTTGNYIIYAVLSPEPSDPTCRPFAQVNLTVNSAPTVTCPTNITVNNDPGQCGAIVNYPPASVTGVPTPSVTYSSPSGSFFPVGTTTVTVTATNSCGTATCTFTVTVRDTEAPQINCPANITTGNSPGQCGAFVNYNVTATDNCPGVTTTRLSGPASGSLFPLGTTTVVWRATDAAGNTSTCSFTVTVNDTQPPTITCPSNITVNNAPNQCGAVVNFTVNVTDNCPLPGATPITLSQNNSTNIVAGSVSCNSGGLHTDNSYYRVFDLAPMGLAGPLTINQVRFGIESANAASGSQPVTVRLHTLSGAFTLANLTLIASQTYSIPNQTLSLYTATLTTPVTVQPTATLVLEIFTPAGAGNSFFIGSNALGQTAPSYILAAPCGVSQPTNLATLGFPNMHIVLQALGTVTPAGSGLTVTPASGSFFPVGTTTVTATATDAAGNTSTCSFTVTVRDVQAPAITCPANITVSTPIGSCSAVVNYNVTATDNCPGVTTALVSGIASGSAFPLGTTTVTWRATDAAGNTATCSFTVTVNDAQIPVISSQPANTEVCAGSTATFTVVAAPLGGPNNLTYQWQQWNGTAFVNIAGAINTTLNVNNVTLAMNGNTYRVLVNGLCTQIISGVATLRVKSLPNVSLSTSRNPSITPGQLVTIMASVNPAGGTIAWYKDGVLIPGALTLSLNNLSVDDAGTYHAVYTAPNGCTATSANVVISKATSDNVFIYPNPSDGRFQVRVYNQNENITVSVYDAKGALVYQKSSTTAAPYTRIDVDLSHVAAGQYLVDVRGAGGSRLGAKQIIIWR